MKGSLIITILVLTCDSFIFTGNQYQGIVGHIPAFSTFLALDFDIFSLIHVSFIGMVLSLFLVDFFDSTGSLIAISHAVQDEHININIERTNQPFVIDSYATILGSLLGTSTATVYIESATGVKQGEKTGLTAVVVGILFLLSLFFFPLVNSIPLMPQLQLLYLLGFCSYKT